MEQSAAARQENLLLAWMEMAVCIRGSRFLSNLSFNESLVCNLLYRQRQSGGPPLTATELCRKTRLLKSQMNQVLSGMEKKGLLCRETSPSDRRSVSLSLREEAIPTYLEEHRHILKIVDQVCSQLGPDRTAELTKLLHAAVAAVTEFKEDP